MEIEVRDARVTEVRHLVAIAARAFWDDPLFNFFEPDLLRQQRSMPKFFQSVIGDCAAHGVVHAAVADGKLAGVAAWLPPGVPLPLKGRRSRTQARLVLPTVLRSSKRMESLRMLSELPKHHLHHEHWYLAILAADPLVQGKGIGSQLLTPVLERCDDAGMPVYLETQKEANLAYYRRFRFELTETIEVRGCPAVFTMTRLPR
jgi:GNAT superfamily N-acetyltransferase